MSVIYGIDTEKPYTPRDVRDAIIKCFISAHSEIMEEYMEKAADNDPQELEEMKKINVEQTVRNYFREIGEDYENPTKESLIKVSEKLVEYAKAFRKPEIIEKHYGEIMELINKL